LSGLHTYKLEEIRRSIEQVKKGYPDETIVEMGFAHGCVLAARRFVYVEAGPYGENNPPVGKS
jgi:hypothetical protein